MAEAREEQRSSPNSTEWTAEEVARLIVCLRDSRYIGHEAMRTAAADALTEARAEIERLRLQVSDAEEDVQRLHKEKCDQLDELIASRTRLSSMQAALEAIIVRCTEGDKRSDWLPVIESIARAALSQKDEQP